MEYRKICNVCHNIWCYTDNDVKENAKNAAVGALASIGSIASAIGGTRYDMYEMNKVSNSATNKIKDFNKCPYCNSTDISDLSEEEFRKINKKKSSGHSGIIINSNASVDALIKRIEIFMEDEEWDDAETYCNQALDVEPENGYLWLLKLLINVEWKFVDDKIIFNNSIRKLTDCEYYDKVQRFSKDDKDLKDKIEQINNEISEYFYSKAQKDMSNAETQADYEKALLSLMELDNYKDSDKLIKECKDNIKEIKDYNLELLAMEKCNSEILEDVIEAKKLYEDHKEWENANEIIKNLDKKIKEINENKEKNKKIIKILVKIAIVVAIILIIFAIVMNNVNLNKKKEQAYQDIEGKIITGKYTYGGYYSDYSSTFNLEIQILDNNKCNIYENTSSSSSSYKNTDKNIYEYYTENADYNIEVANNKVVFKVNTKCYGNAVEPFVIEFDDNNNIKRIHTENLNSHTPMTLYVKNGTIQKPTGTYNEEYNCYIRNK